MLQKQSFFQLTPVPSSKSLHTAKESIISPDQFLNDFSSMPTLSIIDDRKNLQPYAFQDINIKKTARRRGAIGGSNSPMKSEQLLPALPQFSQHIKSERNFIHSFLQQQEIVTQREANELENVNKKIKSIINSKRKQVTFQKSVVFINDQGNSEIEFPYIKESPTRRKTQQKSITTMG